MESINYLLQGFAVCLQPINLLYTFVGVLLGTIIGVLPGIGPAAGIALLIPITYGMNSTSAIILMAGLYYGARYGGSTTSILIRTPGEAASVMTSLDGYEMAKKGRAGAALAIAAIGSFIAGTIGVVGITLFSLPLTVFALKFGPAEYFCLMLLAMSFGVVPDRLVAGEGAAGDRHRPHAGDGRHRSAERAVPVHVRRRRNSPTASASSRSSSACSRSRRCCGRWKACAAAMAPPPMRISGRLWLTREEWRRSIGPIWRGSIIGFIVGVLPGAGGAIASFFSYITEKKLSKNPEEFGRGAIEGVAGPEAANNSDTAGAMIPLLTLGIPGGGTTAVLGGVLIMHGIQPGPNLFEKHPDLVWGLIASMYVGNVMLLILNLPLVGSSCACSTCRRDPVSADHRHLRDRRLRTQLQHHRPLPDPGLRRARIPVREGRHSDRAAGAVAGTRRDDGAIVPAGYDGVGRQPQHLPAQQCRACAGRLVSAGARAAVDRTLFQTTSCRVTAGTSRTAPSPLSAYGRASIQAETGLCAASLAATHNTTPISLSVH